MSIVQIMPAPWWVMLEIYQEGDEVKHAVAPLVAWGLDDEGEVVPLVIDGEHSAGTVMDDAMHLSIVIGPGEAVPDDAAIAHRFEEHREMYQRVRRARP